MRKSRFQIVAAATMALTLVVVGAAVGDELQGDELSSIRETGSLDLGTVCAGEDASGTVFLAIVRRANGAPQVYANGATVTISATEATEGLTAGAASDTITVPGDWDEEAFGTMTASVTATVTLNTDATGAFSGSVTYESAGEARNGENRTFADTIVVTADVEDCGDDTAPEVTITLSPSAPDGDNGWYVTPVTVTIVAEDDESDVESVEYSLDGSSWQAYTGAFTVSADDVYTVSARATSEGGTSDPVSESFSLDATAPSVDISLDPASPNGDNGWYTTAVTATFTATDDLSGFDAGGTATSTATASTASLEGTSLSLSSPVFTDWAGNTVAAGAASATVQVDLTDPRDVAFVGGPTEGGSYVFGSVPAEPTCTAADDVSGLAGCVVTGYGTSVGTHVLTATATDNAGRTTTATRTYEVLPWTLEGFHRPVDVSATNTVKAGSTAPLKFNVFAGDVELTDTSVATVSFTRIGCTTSDDEEPIEGTTTGGTTYRYDTTGGQFIYNWQTPKTGAGNCYRVTLRTLDGSSTSAIFRLK